MNGPRFVYSCATCGQRCRFKRGKIKVPGAGKPTFAEGLGKPNCPTHGPTKARRKSEADVAFDERTRRDGGKAA